QTWELTAVPRTAPRDLAGRFPAALEDVLMKLLLICLDGLRIDMALPEVVATDPGFAAPDHDADPRFRAGAPDHTADPPDHPADPAVAPGSPLSASAPTLRRLADGGTVVPIWMTPPTDSGPGWSSLLTGTTHE